MNVHRQRLVSGAIVLVLTGVAWFEGAGYGSLAFLALALPIWFAEEFDAFTVGTGMFDGPFISKASTPTVIRFLGWILLILTAGAMAVGVMRGTFAG